MGLDGTVEATIRNTLFQRYNKICSTLMGGTQRYVPIYMRTDDGEVLLKEFANGFYFGMQLAIDAWLPSSSPSSGVSSPNWSRCST